jgi:hypothetical protein
MSIRTTVTLDDDVVERVKAESRSRGASFKETLNDLLRVALTRQASERPRIPFKVKAYHLGKHPCMKYTKTEEMLECLEGKDYR